MYIDPNTGGMLFQILVVIFSALTGVFLVFSGRIRAFIGQMRRRFRKNDAVQTSNKISTKE
jgi:hypothetical protein